MRAAHTTSPPTPSSPRFFPAHSGSKLMGLIDDTRQQIAQLRAILAASKANA